MSEKLWGTFVQDNGDIAVMPIDDLYEHEPASKNCLCHPIVELVGAHLLIVHNAFDKRHIEELFQEAVR